MFGTASRAILRMRINTMSMRHEKHFAGETILSVGLNEDRSAGVRDYEELKSKAITKKTENKQE